MLFSQRQGITPASKAIQFESIDQDLRTALWNAYYIWVWQDYIGVTFPEDSERQFLGRLSRLYWTDYFKNTIDTCSTSISDSYSNIKDYFFRCDWYAIFDLIELTLPEMDEYSAEGFSRLLNSALEKENSAYRVSGMRFIECSDDVELKEIDEALATSTGISSVHRHLESALQLYANREEPDYRNSIKEAISAVEALCRLVVGQPDATLGQALKAMSNKGDFHPTLTKAFSSLYGYTCDAHGIRHAMMDDKTLTSIDAKFMLVSCSAFINYVKGKCVETGIVIE